VWVAVGGRGTLIGPILGAIGVNALKSWATRAFPDLWLLILGTLFIVVTLFFPKGLVGIPEQVRALKRRLARKLPSSPPAATASKSIRPTNGKQALEPK